MPKQIIASKDVIVHDDDLGIDRQIVAGQPVPPELVKAYTGKTGEKVEDVSQHEGSSPVVKDAAKQQKSPKQSSGSST